VLRLFLATELPASMRRSVEKISAAGRLSEKIVDRTATLRHIYTSNA